MTTVGARVAVRGPEGQRLRCSGGRVRPPLSKEKDGVKRGGNGPKERLMTKKGRGKTGTQAITTVTRVTGGSARVFATDGLLAFSSTDAMSSGFSVIYFICVTARLRRSDMPIERPT